MLQLRPGTATLKERKNVIFPCNNDRDFLLLIGVKEESEKAGLKFNIQKTKMASGPITSWQIEGEKNGSGD